MYTSPSPGLRLPLTQVQPGVDSPRQETTTMSGSSSPPAPPYSPITPEMTFSELAASDNEFHYGTSAQGAQQPPNLPFSETDSADAMALRSAISILQIQRQQTLRDMKTLEEQKKLAVADPEGFSEAVHSGRVKTKGAEGQFIVPLLDVADEARANGVEDVDMDMNGDGGSKSAVQTTNFKDMPGAQNVVRCPPIEWAKYKIVGESLDKLHEEQRARPASGQPHDEGNNGRAPENVIAAPYVPWKDKLPESSIRTRDLDKKKG